MDWCMQNESFKVQLLRFVDVFPSLQTSDQLIRHIQEYFDIQNTGNPFTHKMGCTNSHFGGSIGGKALSFVIKHQMKKMAQQFIIGENIKPSIERLTKLRAKGYFFRC